MARQNKVSLYGYVTEPPVIVPDKNGNPIRGMVHIATVRGHRSIGNNLDDVKYDRPTVLSGDPTLIPYIADLKPNDMVSVKGAITTKNVLKATHCPHCNHKNTIQGTITFVSPIFVDKREEGLTSDEIVHKLQSKWEISNEVSLLGNVCREPTLYVTSSGTSIASYQMAVNRSYRIKDDAEENRTDFPWVKTYGTFAEDDVKHIHRKTRLLINGRIQTRKRKRTQTCEHCGAEYIWDDVCVEVVPYSTEYLADYVSDEEISKEEEQKLLEAKKRIFGEDYMEMPDTPPDTTGIETYQN